MIKIFHAGAEDYDAITAMAMPIEFSPNSPDVMCLNISIATDFVIEDAEEFHLVINSTDDAVILSDSMSTILVLDSTSK